MAQAFEGPEQQAHNERLQLEAKGNQKKSFAVENLAVFKYAQVIIKSNGDLFKEVEDTTKQWLKENGWNCAKAPNQKYIITKKDINKDDI